MRYFLFQAVGPTVGPVDCTTDMPEGCLYSIKASGVYEGRYTNIMECNGELGDWVSLNSTKVTEITSDDVAIWIANLTPKQPLTKLEFRSRFTFEELVAIEVAAETDAMIRVLNQNQAVADFIDITDARTIAGINLLVSKTLITQERADAILAS
jgi:hypothetical protein